MRDLVSSPESLLRSTAPRNGSHALWQDAPALERIMSEVSRSAPDHASSVNAGARGRRSDRGLSQNALRVGSVLAAATLIGFGLREGAVSEANIALVYVLAVAVIAYVTHRRAAVAAALLAVLAFNFFFTDPRFTLTVHDPGYLVTFGVMVVVGLTISGLASRVRRQASEARQRADVNEALYRVSRQLATATSAREVVTDLHRSVERLTGGEAAVVLDPTEHDARPEAAGSPRLLERLATLASEPRPAGSLPTDAPDGEPIVLPLESRAHERLGILAVDGNGYAAERHTLLLAIAAIAGQALEREVLSERVRRAALEVEAERIRSDLLAIVSHDLRTPLSAISGAATAVLASAEAKLDEGELELLRDVSSESDRLIHLVENLLQLSRLEEGNARLHADWIPVDELVDGALRHAGRAEDTARVQVHLPAEPLLAWADGTIATQVLFNLVGNALEHGRGADVRVAAQRVPGGVEFVVTDRGPGFPRGDPQALERFVTGAARRPTPSSGRGLGLAICRSAVRAHGGVLSLSNEPSGGAHVAFVLPDPVGPCRPTATTEELLA